MSLPREKANKETNEHPLSRRDCICICVACLILWRLAAWRRLDPARRVESRRVEQCRRITTGAARGRSSLRDAMALGVVSLARLQRWLGRSRWQLFDRSERARALHQRGRGASE